MLRKCLKYVIVPVLGYSTVSVFTLSCTALTLFSYGRSIKFGEAAAPIVTLTATLKKEAAVPSETLAQAHKNTRCHNCWNFKHVCHLCPYGC